MPFDGQTKKNTQRGLFYFRTHIGDKGNLGVINKCLGIVEAFEAYGLTCDHFFFTETGLVKNKVEELPVGFPTPKNSVGHLLLFLIFGGRLLLRNCNLNDYGFIYIRHLPTSPILICRLRRIKKQYPQLKILLEIPTYPYDAEMKTFWGRGILAIDRFYRKKLKGLIDVILVDVPESEVFGVPALYIPIGIPQSRIKNWGNAPAKVPSPVIKLIFIGNISFWHGLDRVVQGLAVYGKTAMAEAYPVELTIVGSGNELPKIKDLIRQLRLEHKVTCLAPKTFEDLVPLLDAAHIGIGTLGAHRKDLSECSSIKHRDYFGMGLPIVFSGIDPDFEAYKQGVFSAPENDSPLALDSLIGWYVERLKTKNFHTGITEFAKNNLLWSKKIKPMIDLILEKGSNQDNAEN